MPALVHRHADRVITPWRNGAGRKADITDGEGWTLALAWLDGDAPFSDYSGVDRTITLLTGGGFALAFDDRPEAVIARPHAPFRFDGGWPSRCRLLGAPCLVLNVMTERRLRRHRVTILPAAPPPPMPAVATLAFVLAGELALPGLAPLGPLDAVTLPPGSAAPSAPGLELAFIEIGTSA